MKMILASEFCESFPATKDIICEHAKGKKLLFIPTAAFAEGWIPDSKTHQNIFMKMGYDVEEFDLAKSTASETYEKIMASDIVFVTGGNTFCLLESMNKTEFKKALQAFFEKDGLYIGYSAGAIVMGNDIQFIAPMDEPEKAKLLKSTAGLGLIHFLFLPHYNSVDETMRQAANNIIKTYLSAEESMNKLIPFTDEQAIFLDNQKIEILNA